jgi:hypothetical protein
MRSRVADLVLGGDEGRHQEFCGVLREALPPETASTRDVIRAPS